jgi:hypothetical protein
METPRYHFSGSYYVRILLTSFIFVIFGIALLGISTLFVGGLAFVNLILVLAGLFLVGIALFGAVAAVIAIFAATRSYLTVDGTNFTLHLSKRENYATANAEIRALCADHETLRAGREGLRLEDKKPLGLRILTSRETILIKRSFMKQVEVAAFERAIISTTHQVIERLKLGPEPVRMQVEGAEITPQAGLMLLTNEALIIYGREKNTGLVARRGYTRLILPLTEISSSEINEKSLKLQARDGVRYQITFAYPPDFGSTKITTLLNLWQSALKKLP